MSYNELIKKLFNVNLFSGMKLGLKNCQLLQELLDFPDHSYKIVHIAGTNGKGSVSTKIAVGLQAAGYRVGLFTSPHISSFRERIRINGHMISEQDTVDILSQLFNLIEKNNIPATFFEITTFLALLYFKKEKVDFAVLETGLGGRLDATNIVTPILSVITSISIDHAEILGSTIEEIAKEKGGIIKPHIPVLIGPHVPHRTIEEMANQNKSPLYQVTETSSTFEEENRTLAKKALELLAKEHEISNEAIAQGLEGRQPCRFEYFAQPCPLLLDVAHNPDGLMALFKATHLVFGKVPLRILFGLSKSKDVHQCIKILAENGHQFHLVEAPNGRGAPVSLLKSELLNQKIKEKQIHIDNTIPQSVNMAIEQAKKNNELLVICGSFFIMSQVRQTLGINEPIDSIDMNER